jgi:hypothetical protein
LSGKQVVPKPVRRLKMRPSGEPEPVPVPPQRRQTPRIPPPRNRAGANRMGHQTAAPTAVAIFDTSVPVYMQTVRETSICPELIPPLRALIAALAVESGERPAGSGATDPDPGSDPGPGPDDSSPHPAGEEE